MNKRWIAVILTIFTLTSLNLQAQLEDFGFKFHDSDQYAFYPVMVYNYESKQWDDTSQSRVRQCIVGQNIYCPYVSSQETISLKLNPDGSVFTLPNIFDEFYLLTPDYRFDDLKTSGLAIMYKSDSLPDFN